MAVFDREQDRIIVRVVYDGLGNAGKTTNIHQICGFFTPQRRSEIYTPEARAGRTLYFDWLQIEGGLVGGHRLRCQVMSVPGQLVLRERRARLLRTADVVVLVCDSTRVGVERARRGIARTQQYMASVGAGDVDFIIQANKQDLPDALSAAEIAALLGGGANKSVVPARAFEGIGVRETIVLALRSAADRVQRMIAEKGLDGIEGKVMPPDVLYAEMREVDTGGLTTSSLLEIFDHEGIGIEEIVDAAKAGTFVPKRPSPSEFSKEQDADPLATALAVPSAPPPAAEATSQVVVRIDPELGRTVDDAFAALAPTDEADGPHAAGADGAEPGGDAEAGGASEESAEVRTIGPLSNRAKSGHPASARVPGWPDPPVGARNVPGGLVWPAAQGREALSRLRGQKVVAVEDRVSQGGTTDGGGEGRLVLYRAGGLCFKTKLDRHYPDADSARYALIELLRGKQLLGDLLPEDTVLAVTKQEGKFWLWTVAPWVDTLEAQMTQADQEGDERALGEALCSFAQAIGQSLALFAEDEVLLDVHPSNFAVSAGRVCYLDDGVKRGGELYPVLRTMQQRMEQYAQREHALQEYVRELETELLDLTLDDLKKLKLDSALADLIARSPEARTSLVTLLASVQQRLGLEPVVPEPVSPERVRSELPPGSESPKSVAPQAGATTPGARTPTEEPLASSEAAAQSRPRPPELPASPGELLSGCIWPAASGRQLLRDSFAHARARSEDQWDVQGRVTYESDGFVLWTSLEDRYADAEEGRAALLARARRQVLSAEADAVVLFLARDSHDDSHWIWTVERAGT